MNPGQLQRPACDKYADAIDQGHPLLDHWGVSVIEHVAGVHWNSLLMCRGICHSEKGYTRQPISADELFRVQRATSLAAPPCNLWFLGESHPPDGSTPPKMSFLASVPKSRGITSI